MMKPITLLAVAAATLLAPPLWAADGTMQFSGKLTEHTCVLDAGSKNQTVNLRKSMTYADSVSSSHDFLISLYNCPTSSSQASIRFEGTQAASSGYDADKAFAFSNTGQPGAAENIGFFIADTWPFGKVSVNGVSKVYDLDTGIGTINNLQFYVGTQYLDPAQKATPGALAGNVQFSIIYP